MPPLALAQRASAARTAGNAIRTGSGRSSARAVAVRAAGGTTTELGRRDLALLGLAAAVAAPLARPENAVAAGFKKELKKRKVPVEDYTPQEASGLRIYDLQQGRGAEIKPGDTVTVHFDCLYRGIDAVSSRYARTLGGNRTVAEPVDFVAGEYVTGQVLKQAGDSAGGLFSGSSGPKPPQALSKAVIGMKPGGKRSVLVDVPELGYPKGNQEIPAGEPFELKIEVLSVSQARAG
ncbi:peptidyl-prolyl cis-trans isomerase chloroplastic [Raphidocelis subcapitata]|uniref:Rotamase n=1 Tax=Raphidocelis subcapitata TaxID=307507 RepID=A0A2V0PFR3_9CHLO|nr:peptidyl-prolyl cis-trans isomerase chloroplastic [Raphidocelis subcapitata]|eukprot:GBF96750.1 peptidyl-prolyl cis-trans isomerase chloroplastic [Raphidocelis subcapitata]